MNRHINRDRCWGPYIPRAHLAVDEEQPGNGVPGQGCVGAATHLAGHVLHDVLAQQRLDVLGHVLA